MKPFRPFPTLRRLAPALLLCVCVPAAAQAVMAPVAQYLIADRNAEIALARSAAPPSISRDAQVLVLGERGFEVAVPGTNGFVCFVERSWDATFDDPDFWNPKQRGPNCINAPAARSVLPQYLARAEWALAGATREELAEKSRAAFASKRFTDPEPGAFSFMLSRQGRLGDDAETAWLPHVMLFVPHGQARTMGAGLDGSPVLGGDGAPFEPTVLFIPVRRWSDGTPGPAPAEHKH